MNCRFPRRAIQSPVGSATAARHADQHISHADQHISHLAVRFRLPGTARLISSSEVMGIPNAGGVNTAGGLSPFSSRQPNRVPRALIEVVHVSLYWTWTAGPRVESAQPPRQQPAQVVHIGADMANCRTRTVTVRCHCRCWKGKPGLDRRKSASPGQTDIVVLAGKGEIESRQPEQTETQTEFRPGFTSTGPTPL